MKKQYSEEFRLEAVRLAQSGDVSVAQLARELGINYHNWISKYGESLKNQMVWSKTWQQKCNISPDA